jgi:hypothetical protein
LMSLSLSLSDLLYCLLSCDIALLPPTQAIACLSLCFSFISGLTHVGPPISPVSPPFPVMHSLPVSIVKACSRLTTPFLSSFSGQSRRRRRGPGRSRHGCLVRLQRVRRGCGKGEQARRGCVSNGGRTTFRGRAYSYRACSTTRPHARYPTLP